MIAWDGGGATICAHHYIHPPFVAFRGGRLTTSWTNTLECGGRLTLVGWTGYHQSPRVKVIGSKTTAPPDGAGAPQRNQYHHGEREDTMTMRHAAPRCTNVATRRPLKRSSEIILATIIYLTASCFAVVGTLGIVMVVWALWGAIGAR